MKIATGFHAFYIDLVYYSTGKLLDYHTDNEYKGGYFFCAVDNVWIGFDSSSGELFQECFKSEAAARNYANGSPTKNIHGYTF